MTNPIKSGDILKYSYILNILEDRLSLFVSTLVIRDDL